MLLFLFGFLLGFLCCHRNLLIKLPWGGPFSGGRFGPRLKDKFFYDTLPYFVAEQIIMAL
jgi:hypothetical protein